MKAFIAVWALILTLDLLVFCVVAFVAWHFLAKVW